jgi:hypothetical protein
MSMNSAILKESALECLQNDLAKVVLPRSPRHCDQQR